MSEKIYAFLFRLFPSHFRKAYGEDALQLFRDRFRDEKSLLPRLRLWLDLLADLFISLPYQYLRAQPAMAMSTMEQRVPGAPSFFVLGDGSPRPSALALGGMCSVAVISLVSILLTQVKTYRDRTNTTYQQQPPDSESYAHQTRQPDLQHPSATTDRAALGPGMLNPEERKYVVNKAAQNLREHYVDPDLGRKMADALLEHERNGDDDGVTDGASFATLLTGEMREVNPDRHLSVDYFEAPLREHSQGQTAEALGRYRDAMQRENCTFERAEILPRNIGYLKFNSFPDLAVCQEKITSAMSSLNHADALIFDLRDNGGGYPAAVAFMAAYLFDHPEYWYNPRENTTEDSWTHSPVAGSLLADKPVYLLTSRRTYSGAEQFSYDLKMLKRAMIVGETTGGAAHSGVFYRLDDHFGMGIPETRAINPFSKTDWAEVGVEPDVKVEAAEALETAIKLAHARLHKK